MLTLTDSASPSLLSTSTRTVPTDAITQTASQSADTVDSLIKPVFSGSTETPSKEKLAAGSPLLHEFILKQNDPTIQSASSEQEEAVLSQENTAESGAIAERQLLPSDPELGVIRVRDSRQDPELGILQLRTVPQLPPPRPYLFLSTYASASSSDNILLIDDPVQGRIGDKFVRPGISLIAFPPLGTSTNLLASIETNAVRYQDFTGANYDELKFRVGVRHSFSRRVYGQLSWSRQLLFREGFQDRFFTNQGIELFVGRRDPLSPTLTLDSYYQAEVFFSDPDDFSDVVLSLGTYLNYRLSPKFDAGVGYQITMSDFTQVNRHETYQRVTGQLRYTLSPSVRMSIFGGFSNGRSSEPNISFDDSFFGISFDATVEIF
ncbi:MAG: hypothetical protein AAGH78_02240 [Cyanobacteria bacterium P01_H01_bin.58]